MADVLANDAWARDLRQRGNNDLVQSFLILWRAIKVANMNLQPQTEDTIVWRLGGSGQYNASSAYSAQFATLQRLTANS